jgi:hypothetical protein
MSSFAKALRKLLVESDFKTSKEKFLQQGVEEQEITITFDSFKEAASKNKIKNIDEKNIDWWAKKPWAEFKRFIEDLSETKTKGEEIKTKANDGAELRAEDDNWVVYKILTQDACIFYGTNKWCISKEGSIHYDSYSKQNDFYFLLSKNRGKDDKWNKVALQVNPITGKKTYWDAKDTSHSSVPADLNLPDFKIDKVDFEAMSKKIEPELIKIRRDLKRLARSYFMSYSDRPDAPLLYVEHTGDGGNVLFSGNVQYNKDNIIILSDVLATPAGDISMICETGLKGRDLGQPREVPFSYEVFAERLRRVTYYLTKN